MTPKITVQGNVIQLSEVNGEKYISLTDMARSFGEPSDYIKGWIRTKDTLLFLGLWEKLHNPDFKLVEFDQFKNEAGTQSFTLSPQKWIETTKAKGIVSTSGRYGGTYAHRDIAVHFGQWLSPEFSLYVIKEFERLKEVEMLRLPEGWQLNRVLSKINYQLHTDAVNDYLVPLNIPDKLKWSYFVEEADILNLSLFGKTAKQWREQNPGVEGNIRDYATQEQLLVLANLETLNSQFIKEKIGKNERFRRLHQIAIEQMRSLLKNPSVKKLKDISTEDKVDKIEG